MRQITASTKLILIFLVTALFLGGCGEGTDTVAQDGLDGFGSETQGEALDPPSQIRAQMGPENQTILVSSVNGVPGDNGSYEADLSEDGQTVVFRSSASNFNVEGSSVSQIYSKNLQTNELTLISTSVTGALGNKPSRTPRVTPDGRHVGFSSAATNLMNDPAPVGYQIYIKNPDWNTLDRLSELQSGEPGNGNSFLSYISESLGVIFSSTADNFVPDTNGVQDVYAASSFVSPWRVSEGANGLELDGRSYHGFRNGSGNLRGFISFASNTGATSSRAIYLGSPFSSPEIFYDGPHDAKFATMSRTNDLIAYVVYNRQSRRNEIWYTQVDAPQNAIKLSSRSSTYRAVSFSGDGRYVAYQTHDREGEVPDNRYDIFVYDSQTGEHRLVSGETPSSASASRPVISGDGSTVAWDQGGQVYARVNPFLEEEPEHNPIVSMDSDCQPANAPCYSPRLSEDGTVVAFSSEATNLVDIPWNGPHIFYKDLSADQSPFELVNVDQEGNLAQLADPQFGLSSDGKRVVFSTVSTLPGYGHLLHGLILSRHIENLSTEIVSRDENNEIYKFKERPRVEAFGDQPFAQSAQVVYSFNPFGNEPRELHYRDIVHQLTSLVTTNYESKTVQMSSTGKVTYRQSSDNDFKIWDFVDSSLASATDLIGFGVQWQVGVSPNGAMLGYTGLTNQGWRFVKLSSEGIADDGTGFQGVDSGGLIFGIPKFSRDNRYSVYIKDGLVKVQDASFEPQIVTATVSSYGDCEDPVISGDGSTIAWCGSDGQIYVVPNPLY